MTEPNHSRRRFLCSVPVLAAAVAVPRVVAADPPEGVKQRMAPDDALKRLLDGNKNFVAGKLTSPGRDPADYKNLAAGQNPVAVVVGCADSRVSPELLFDLGMGDLFVIRVAGNVVRGSGPVVTGSIEYAVSALGVPLVVILGHSGCGAVKAAIEYPDPDDLPYSLAELVDTIKPAVTDARRAKEGDLLENAIRANVRRGVKRLLNRDPVVAAAVEAKRLRVVGATYNLKDGQVSVLD